MPNSLSAQKRQRQNVVRRERNRSHRSAMRTAIKKVREATEQGDFELARQLLRAAYQMLDRAAARNIIHANKAARTKSRLSLGIRRIDPGAANTNGSLTVRQASRRPEFECRVVVDGDKFRPRVTGMIADREGIKQRKILAPRLDATEFWIQLAKEQKLLRVEFQIEPSSYLDGKAELLKLLEDHELSAHDFFEIDGKTVEPPATNADFFADNKRSRVAVGFETNLGDIRLMQAKSKRQMLFAVLKTNDPTLVNVVVLDLFKNFHSEGPQKEYFKLVEGLTAEVLKS